MPLPRTAVFGWVELSTAHVSEITSAILGQWVSWGTPGIDSLDGVVRAVIVREGPAWSVEVEGREGDVTVVPLASVYNTWAP